MNTTDPLADLDEVLRTWENTPGKELRKLRREIKVQGQDAGRLQVIRCARDLFTPPGQPDEFDAIYPKLEPPLRRLLWNYAIADAIAIHYRSPALKTGGMIALSVALAGAGLWTLNNAGTLIPTGSVLAGALDPIRMAGASFLAVFTFNSLVCRGQFRKRRTNYLTARSLAEAIRVDFFQRLAGTGFDTPRHFTEQQTSSDSKGPSVGFMALELALTNSGLPIHPTPTEQPPDSERLAWTRRYWIEAQHNYFAGPNGAAQREAAHENATERQLRICFGLTTAAILVTLAFMLAPHAANLPFLKGNEAFSEAVLTHALRIPKAIGDLVTPMLGIAAAFLHQKAAAHAVTAQKYRRAALVLSRAIEDLKPSNLSHHSTVEILEGVAYHSIAETADWGVHQREQSNHIAFR
jgi:hypothetical protein